MVCASGPLANGGGASPYRHGGRAVNRFGHCWPKIKGISRDQTGIGRVKCPRANITGVFQIVAKELPCFAGGRLIRYAHEIDHLGVVILTNSSGSPFGCRHFDRSAPRASGLHRDETISTQ